MKSVTLLLTGVSSEITTQGGDYDCLILSSHCILFDMEQTRWLKSTALSRGQWPYWPHTRPHPKHSCSGILIVGTRINPDFYRAAQSPESRSPNSLTLSPCLSDAKLQLLAQSLWHIFLLIDVQLCTHEYCSTYTSWQGLDSAKVLKLVGKNIWGSFSLFMVCFLGLLR